MSFFEANMANQTTFLGQGASSRIFAEPLAKPKTTEAALAGRRLFPFELRPLPNVCHTRNMAASVARMSGSGAPTAQVHGAVDEPVRAETVGANELGFVGAFGLVVA